jgi:hypothetical protein
MNKPSVKHFPHLPLAVHTELQLHHEFSKKLRKAIPGLNMINEKPEVKI